ncbi:hypothetical protein NY588_12380 [Curtobacterium flaccumfaciens pv. beticola]|uniref:hypothetical protein n=1 Tax=Curtobacterium flaccumfaciens TaxID=2035 RepID=UPI00349FA6A9|nr:hypothetical protein [Curtobacterium flaccumfaciens pv. basellae]
MTEPGHVLRHDVPLVEDDQVRLAVLASERALVHGAVADREVPLQDGVNRFNADRIAEELSSADRVRFTIGGVSYDMRALTAVFGMSPTAYAYEVEP